MTGRNMKRWSYSELKGQWIIFYPLVRQRLNADEGLGQSITLLVRNTLESNLELFAQNINAQSNFLFRNLAYGQSHSHKDSIQKCPLHHLNNRKLKCPSKWSRSGRATINRFEGVKLVFMRARALVATTYG